MKRNSMRILILASVVMGLAAGLPLLADTRIEKTLDLGPGGKFVLDSEGGGVTVTGSSRSDIHVVITSKRDDLESVATFAFEAGSEMAKVTMTRKKSSVWNRGLSLSYTIEVPNQTQLEIKTSGGSITVTATNGEAQLRTSGGSIKVNDLEGPVNARTSGGSIKVADITGDITASTSGGSIRASRINGQLNGSTSGGSIDIEDVSDDLSVKTSGGSIDIEGAGGMVDARTSGGSVSVAFLPGNERGGDLSTSGGGIRVTLDSAANLDLDAHCSGGSVKTALPVRVVGDLSKNTIKGPLGAGGATLKLRTSGGSIRIDAI